MPRILRLTANKRHVFARVRLHALHPADTSKWAVADRVSGHLRVAKRRHPIKKISLDPNEQRHRLVVNQELGKRVVRRSGTMRLRVRIPRAVGVQLTRATRSQLMDRVDMQVFHYKDTRRRIPGWDLQQMGSSLNDLAGSGRDRRFGVGGPNYSAGYQMTNDTPFNVVFSTQGTQCVDQPGWVSDSIPPGGGAQSAITILDSGETNGSSTWESLASGAVSALEADAQNAVQQPVSTVTSFSSGGLVKTAVDWTTNFVKQVIEGVESNSCSSAPAYWTTSWAVTGSPTTDPGYIPWWPPDTSLGWVNDEDRLPSNLLAQYLGAQGVAQWQWNGGNPQIVGSGSSYFVAGMAPGAMWTPDEGMVYMAVGLMDTDVQRFGPQSGVGPTATWTPTGGGGGQISCDLPEYQMVFPWTSTQVSLSNPPAGYDVTGYSAATFFYNAQTGSGQTQFAQPFDPFGVAGTVDGGFNPNAPFTLAVSPSLASQIEQTLNGGTITGYGCTATATAQVPNWPNDGMTAGQNIGWTSYPPMADWVPAS